jgi:hypothetical protein
MGGLKYFVIEPTRDHAAAPQLATVVDTAGVRGYWTKVL